MNAGEKQAVAYLDTKGLQLGQLLTYMWYCPFLGFLVGLIIAFVISLVISFRKNWFWFNSLIVLIVSFVLGRFNFFGLQNVKGIIFIPAHLLNNEILYILTNGLILLSMGIFVFSFNKFNNFIATSKWRNLPNK